MQLLSDLYVTCARVFVWTSISWLVGLVVGYGSYKSRLIYKILLPLINLFRHISPFCWLPLIIIISGIGEISVGLVLLLAMLFTAIIMTTEIMRNIPTQYLEQAALDGAREWDILVHIELPLAMGEFVNLYRILWSVGWVTVIAAEMLGVQSGMGYRLLDYRYLLMYKEMMLYILIIGFVGICTDYLLIWSRKRLAF